MESPAPDEAITPAAIAIGLKKLNRQSLAYMLAAFEDGRAFHLIGDKLKSAGRKARASLPERLAEGTIGGRLAIYPQLD